MQGTVSNLAMIDDATAWAAVLRRDRAYDGKFVTGVLTTGIYCRPSCAARHPARQNVRFFAEPSMAEAAGLRACLRCLPKDLARDETAMRTAINLLSGEAPPQLHQLAETVGYAPHHFQRLFKRATGVSPAQFARAVRAKRAETALERHTRVTDAIYDAGYSAPSRFYEDASDRLGMTPSAWRRGGADVNIKWTVVETSLGRMLLAATERGICRLSFDEDEKELIRRFPNARIEEGGASMADLVAGAVAAVETPSRMPDLPIDVAGTAFQQAVWAELRRIPPGETRSYAQIAAAVGKPAAVRAAGSANGANNVAVLIPCHRVVRTDGSLGGYAYGLDRKRTLLEKRAQR